MNDVPRTRHGGWVPLSGITLTLLGHATAVAAAWSAAEKYGAKNPTDDLDAGGRFAAIASTLSAYAAVHTVMLIGVVIAWAYGPRQLKVGVLAGWVFGWMVIVGAVGWMAAG